MANLRTSLYDWHLSRKARMVPFAGWDMPVQYAGIIEEHRAVRSGAGLFDISHMGRLSFGGADALPLIERVFSNSAATMKDMQVRYGLVCNDSGGVLDDVLVYRWPYGWAMVVNASNRKKIVDWLHAQAGELNTDNVQIHDQTESTCMLAVQGPKAVALCAGMFEANPAALHYYHAAPTRWKGRQCVISRTGYTGEDGLEIMAGAQYAVELAEELVAGGAVPCGLGARDTLRLEAAMPLYGHELTEEIDPFQAGLGWAVKLDKGDFVGREALRKRKDDNTPSRRVGLEVEGKRAAREGALVLVDGEEIGKVTSGSFAPTLEKSIAMAYVEPAYTKEGSAVVIDIRGTLTPARVMKLPFYRRK
jgi:glycine cleavage system T protein (aminomethyltransferase)